MRRIFQLAIALGALATATALPARAGDAAKAQRFFVLVYSTGPAWKPGVPMAGQNLRPHFEYWKALRDAHKLFLAGPLIDSNGGLLLLRAGSLEEAKNMMAHDPAIIGKIFIGEAHSWRDALDAGTTAKDFLAAP